MPPKDAETAKPKDKAAKVADEYEDKHAVEKSGQGHQKPRLEHEGKQKSVHN